MSDLDKDIDGQKLFIKFTDYVNDMNIMLNKTEALYNNLIKTQNNIEIRYLQKFFESDFLKFLTDIDQTLLQKINENSALSEEILLLSKNLTELKRIPNKFLESFEILPIFDCESIIIDIGNQINSSTYNLGLISKSITNEDSSTPIESHIEAVNNTYSNIANIIFNSKSEIELLLRKLNSNLSITLDLITNINHINSEKFNNDYLERFKEDTDLIVRKFENEIDNLTKKFTHSLKSLELNVSNVSKSAGLLSTSVDAGLKSLGEMNERTQNIELEFSKIIGAESEKVKADLNVSKTKLMKIVEDVKTEVYMKVNTVNIEANTKLDSINTAHNDFINLVEKAGIYELTQNGFVAQTYL